MKRSELLAAYGYGRPKDTVPEETDTTPSAVAQLTTEELRDLIALDGRAKVHN